jgi:hypothetical protein
VVGVDNGQFLAADAPNDKGGLVGAGHDKLASLCETEADDVSLVELGKGYNWKKKVQISAARSTKHSSY